MSAPDLFLGIDGGGTKTAYCLLRADGRIVAECRDGETIYPLPRGPEHVTRTLGEGVRGVCARAGVRAADIAHAFVGIPTYGEVSTMVAALDAAPRAALGHERYGADNDMVCGWAGSLAARDGINVISGTGSMTYGERAGATARVGGWGDLFGDEGSAYWIAIRALNTFTRMSDGREPRGPLLDALAEHLELGTELDLVDVVLNRWSGDRARIASLCRVVAAAASAGDGRAAAIFDDAAGELAQLIVTTWRALGSAAETTTVSYSGGVFATGELIITPLRDALGAAPGDFELRRPRYPPSLGAALYAARLHGTPLTPEALARLDAST